MSKVWQSEVETDEMTSTWTGVGQWVGLIDTTMAVRERHREELEGRSERFVDIVQAQQDRYLWFWDQIDEPRSVEECRAVLYERPDRPAAWERALVELSRWTTTSAKLALEDWEPPAGNLELELFHKICLSQCRDAYGGPGGDVT